MHEFLALLEDVPQGGFKWFNASYEQKLIKKYACSYSVLLRNPFPTISHENIQEKTYMKQFKNAGVRGPRESEMLLHLTDETRISFKMNEMVFLTKEGFCGTPDAIGESDGMLCLAEFKSTESALNSSTHRSQLCKAFDQAYFYKRCLDASQAYIV